MTTDEERGTAFAEGLTRNRDGRPEPLAKELLTEFHDIGGHAPETEFPNYYVRDSSSLFAYSELRSFELGTGASIYANSLLHAFLSAKTEIILVTCFWAKSWTLTLLSETLSRLAIARKKHIGNITQGSGEIKGLPVLRVRICFSSRSALQKLFHPQSRAGYIYPSSQLSRKLGLPSQQVLEDGFIDLQVKSQFFLPFSVLHPKFLIVDRERAWLPSCNVSWEPWLEGSVEMKGDIVAKLLQFYQQVWDISKDGPLPSWTLSEQAQSLEEILQQLEPLQRSKREEGLQDPEWLKGVDSPARTVRHPEEPLTRIPTIVLPSSHHRNPHFRFLFQRYHPPPPTPLNQGISRLFDIATRSIYLQSPNMTSPPVMEMLLQALRRGVDITITTSKGLMTIEQLVTAGTTTSRCLRGLIKQYISLSSTSPSPTVRAADTLESQTPRLGRLRISYFRPNQTNVQESVLDEPVQSHLKLMIVDGLYTVLGSGNMDRASWYTSQELGILFLSEEVAGLVQSAVDSVLEGRRKELFDSFEE